MKCPWIEIEFTEPIDIAGAEIYYFREFQYVNIRAGLNATTMVHHAESWSMDQSKQWITKIIKVRFSNCMQLHQQKKIQNVANYDEWKPFYISFGTSVYAKYVLLQAEFDDKGNFGINEIKFLKGYSYPLLLL